MAEKNFHLELGKYSDRKNNAIKRLQSMDRTLRDREHRYCMKIWTTVIGERDSRRHLEQISQATENLKKALELAYQFVYFSGQGQMRYYNGFVMKLWKKVHIRLSGSTLRLGHLNHDNPDGTHLSQQKRVNNSIDATVEHGEDTMYSSKSRTIMIENIDCVEISLSLPLFPRVQKVFKNRQSPQETDSDLHHSPQNAKRVYFTLNFKQPSNPLEVRNESSSPYLKKQREKSQAPPKHPIVLSLNSVSAGDSSYEYSAGAFLKAMKCAMPEVPITGATSILSEEPHDTKSTSINHLRLSSLDASRPSPTEGNQALCNSPSDWNHLGSARTSVESLLTANSSMDSNRARSSQGSYSQHRSTLSSIDEPTSELDQDEDVIDSRKRPCPLGSVIEERESRVSNDSQSSHSRNNSNSIRGSGAMHIFSSEVIAEHKKYVSDEFRANQVFAADKICDNLDTSSPRSRSTKEQGRFSDESIDTALHPSKVSSKRVIEKNGISLCENTSSVADEDILGNCMVSVDWASVESDELNNEDTLSNEKYTEFADTIGGVKTRQQTVRDAKETTSTHSLLSNYSTSQSLNDVVACPKNDCDVAIERGGAATAKVQSSRRPSLLAISLQNSHALSENAKHGRRHDFADTQVTAVTDPHVSNLRHGQMSYSDPERVWCDLGKTSLDNSVTSSKMSSEVDHDLKVDSACSKQLANRQSGRMQAALRSSMSDLPLLDQTVAFSDVNLNDVLGTDLASDNFAETSPMDGNLISDSNRSLSLSIEGQSRSSLCLPPRGYSSSAGDGRHSISTPGRHSFSAGSVAHLPKPQKKSSMITAKNDSPQPVSNLLRALSKVRSQRDTMQSQLVNFITKREEYLEILHYLQSLRTLVKSPPTTPLLYKPNSTPDSVLTHIKKINRKAFSLLTLTRYSEECLSEVRQNSEDILKSGRERGMSTYSNAEEEFFYNDDRDAVLPDYLQELDISFGEQCHDSFVEKSNLCSIRDLSDEKGEDRSGHSVEQIENSYEAEKFVTKMLDSSTDFITTTQESNMLSSSLQSNNSGHFITFDKDTIDGHRYMTPSPRAESKITSNDHEQRGSGSLLSSGLVSSVPSYSSDRITSYFRDSDGERDFEAERINRSGNNNSDLNRGSGINSLAQLGAPPRQALDLHSL